MIVHSNKYFKNSAESATPPDEFLDKILYVCEEAYSSCVWHLREDFLSYEAFLRHIPRLDMTSSPGYPYMKEAPTNGQWLHWNGIKADSMQLQRLWHDVQRFLDGEYPSYLRAFIKQEPHKVRKAQEKRWRLIIASSLPIQMLWHMLFSPLNDLEIEKAYEIPSQQGIVLVQGGWKTFHRSWRERGLNCGLDKSAWDWTAPKWAIDLDLELRRRLGRGESMSRWFDVAKSLYRNMFEDPKIILSDGSVYQQVVPGVMKSGCVNTISINSHCQVFMHIVVCLENHLPIDPLPVCCGDDTLQNDIHVRNLESYNKYGVVVKSASDTMEFVGHEFQENGPRPLYIYKHLKRLMYTTDAILPQYLDSMARMYVHTEYFYWWEQLARGMGSSLPLSKESYKYWYDYEI